MPTFERYKALTAEELRDIQTRRRGDPDIRRLLGHIFRLRAIALQSDQMLRMLGPGDPRLPSYFDRLIAAPLNVLLNDEPAVIERRARTAEVLRGPDKSVP